MEVNTKDIKEKMIIKIQELNVFVANNQGNINPKNLSKVMETIEKLEGKMKVAFREDDNLDNIIVDFEKEIADQEKHINRQETRVNEMNNTTKQSDQTEEYKKPDDVLKV